MEIQWGNSPEYTIYLFADLRYWALPLSIHWYNSRPVRCCFFNISIRFLCFCFTFDAWEWNKEPNKLTQETMEKTNRGEDLHTVNPINKLLEELEND